MSMQMNPYCPFKNSEPSLQELLNDPTLHLVMARDGISLEDLNDFITQMRTRIIAMKWRQAA